MSSFEVSRIQENRSLAECLQSKWPTKELVSDGGKRTPCYSSDRIHRIPLGARTVLSNNINASAKEGA